MQWPIGISRWTRFRRFSIKLRFSHFSVQPAQRIQKWTWLPFSTDSLINWWRNLRDFNPQYAENNTIFKFPKQKNSNFFVYSNFWISNTKLKYKVQRLYHFPLKRTFIPKTLNKSSWKTTQDIALYLQTLTPMLPNATRGYSFAPSRKR